MFITSSKCLQCDGGLSPGLCCEITELDWHLYIQEHCTRNWFSSFASDRKYSMVQMTLRLLYKSTKIAQIVLYDGITVI